MKLRPKGLKRCARVGLAPFPIRLCRRHELPAQFGHSKIQFFNLASLRFDVRPHLVDDTQEDRFWKRTLRREPVIEVPPRRAEPSCQLLSPRCPIWVGFSRLSATT